MKVLRAFDCAPDGIHAVHLNIGDDASSVPVDLLNGLIAEGYISPANAARAKMIERAPETGAAVGLKKARSRPLLHLPKAK